MFVLVNTKSGKCGLKDINNKLENKTLFKFFLRLRFVANISRKSFQMFRILKISRFYFILNHITQREGGGEARRALERESSSSIDRVRLYKDSILLHK